MRFSVLAIPFLPQVPTNKKLGYIAKHQLRHGPLQGRKTAALQGPIDGMNILHEPRVLYALLGDLNGAGQ